jgi:hypothetical protein
MHRCAECGKGCVCGGDFARFVSEAPNPKCCHCAPACDHGVSFDEPCAQCDELIHAAEDELDGRGEPESVPTTSHNGGW